MAVTNKQYNLNRRAAFYISLALQTKHEALAYVTAGEAGMLIGEIKQGNATREFEGYADKKATASKVSRDVFIKGDSYFLTGQCLPLPFSHASAGNNGPKSFT